MSECSHGKTSGVWFAGKYAATCDERLIEMGLDWVKLRNRLAECQAVIEAKDRALAWKSLFSAIGNTKSKCPLR